MQKRFGDGSETFRLLRSSLPGLVCVLAIATVLAGDARAAEKPNILLILADGLGYGDVGCYNDRSKIATPRIDRLAQEGMRFTDAQ